MRKMISEKSDRKWRRAPHGLATMLVALLAVGFAAPTSAQESVFQGQTVEVIVPHGAGGGFDAYVRAAAPYLGDYLGATIVVNNVTGAGGNVGRNRLYRASPDGLTIGFTSFSSMIFSQLSGADGVEYDVNDWEILGRVIAESEVLSVPRDGRYQSLEELRSAEGTVRIPLSGVGDDTFFKAVIVAKALGINVLPVTGYAGAAEAFAAGMRGDGELLSSSIGSSLTLIEQGEITPILQIALVPDTVLDDVPLASELIEDETMNGFVESIAGISELDRVFFAPPGVPEERLEILRDAVTAAIENPEFLASMEQSGRGVNFMTAEEATAIFEEAMAGADDLIPLLQEALVSAQ